VHFKYFLLIVLFLPIHADTLLSLSSILETPKPFAGASRKDDHSYCLLDSTTLQICHIPNKIGADGGSSLPHDINDEVPVHQPPPSIDESENNIGILRKEFNLLVKEFNLLVNYFHSSLYNINKLIVQMEMKAEP
jgi:hypothetical protein